MFDDFKEWYKEWKIQIWLLLISFGTLFWVISKG